MDTVEFIGRRLAHAVLRERFSEDSVVRLGGELFANEPVWLRSLAQRLIKQFGERQRPRRYRVERFIAADVTFQKAIRKKQFTLAEYRPASSEMAPANGGPQQWQVPALGTTDELARWLNLRPGDLDWFADRRTLGRKLPDGRLCHYRYRWVKKRNGSARLIESPKQHLKMLQRRLLTQILDRIPPHPAAHGFRSGHSIKTFAEPHCGRQLVLKVDLKDFFPSVHQARVEAIFMTAGYPEEVASLLAGLCTNATPMSIIREGFTSGPNRGLASARLHQVPHLPQGAPTSPALANLAAYRFDRRLAGLAQFVGATYTRYADDLVFSGGEDFARVSNRFYIRVCAIALEEGFEINTRKTRFMRRAMSQRATGLVLNSYLNVPRDEFDRLKAILHNCATRGTADQNRDQVPDFQAHLAGRIAHVGMVHPERGEKLRAIFDRIEWE